MSSGSDSDDTRGNLENDCADVGIEYEVCVSDVVPVVSDVGCIRTPERKLEECIRELARGLRDIPTLPQGVDDSDSGVWLPRMHCAFELDDTGRACCWVGETSAELEVHLMDKHTSSFESADTWISSELHMHNRWLDMYCEAIRIREEECAPAVGCSIDRRAHAEFMDRIQGEPRVNQFELSVWIR